VYICETSGTGEGLQALKQSFIYDESELKLLERSLSAERLGPYLQMAKGDRRYAIALYEWNTKVSEALYGVTQGLEVALRNSFHEVLTAAYNRDDWYEVAPLLSEQIKQVGAAKSRIIGDGRVLTSGRVVAELMFGFWTALCGKAYAQQLWDQHLHKAFRTARVGRKAAAKRLAKIRFLRNRVAHHECIIGRLDNERNLRQDCREIFEALGWICDSTARWVASTSSFDQHYAVRPADPNKEPMLPIAASALTK
jgi:hypothetical protein